MLLGAGILIRFLGVSISGFNTNRECATDTAFARFLDALICGVAVLTARILLYVLPKYHVIFGFLGFEFSVLSVYSGGGLGIGIILGITGAACGVDWKSGCSLADQRIDVLF